MQRHVTGLTATNTQPEWQRALTNTKHKHTFALKKLHLCLDEVRDIEAYLEIADSERWTSDHPQRQAVADTMNKHDYHKALDDVEHLVVMRLFELTKLNQAGTGG